MSATYVYGVVSAGDRPPSEARGIEDARIELITEEGIGALTSEVPEEYIEAGREELLTHSRVLGEALERGSVVLPMRFGVVMPDPDAVSGELLAPHREELVEQLAEMEAKVEVNVKVLHDEQRVLAEIVAENPEIAELRESIRDKPEDATYYERIRLGELVAATFAAKREADSDAVVTALSPRAVAMDLAEPVHERMAVNVSFLVRRAQLEEFDRAVDELGAAQAGRIRFKYMGPLPPHSFVELGIAA